MNRSGRDWALESHKHHTDKQTCDFSLWNIWRFEWKKKNICISACWQTPAGIVCSYQTLSLSLLLRLLSVCLFPLTLSFTHTPTIGSRSFPPDDSGQKLQLTLGLLSNLAQCVWCSSHQWRQRSVAGRGQSELRRLKELSKHVFWSTATNLTKPSLDNLFCVCSVNSRNRKSLQV